MSASETGDDSPLVHLRNSVRNIESPSAPASRTVSTISAKSRAECPDVSATGNRQPLDPQCRRVNAVLEDKIVRRRQAPENIEQMPCDRHLADRIGHLAILDPKAAGATAVIAGNTVDAGPDQIGDVEALLDVADQVGRRDAAGFHMQVIGTWRRR